MVGGTNPAGVLVHDPVSVQVPLMLDEFAAVRSIGTVNVHDAVNVPTPGTDDEADEVPTNVSSTVVPLTLPVMLLT